MNDESDTTAEQFDQMWDEATWEESLLHKHVIAGIIYRELMRNVQTSTGVVPPWVDRAAEAVVREYMCRRCGYGLVDLGCYGNACNDCRPRMSGEKRAGESV